MNHELRCERSVDAAAFVQGETVAPDFEQHLAGCADCRAEVEACRRTLTQVSGLRVQGSRDLAPDILARVRREPLRVRWLVRVAALAACLLLAFGITRLEPTSEKSRAIGSALTWLRSAQDSTGGWAVGVQGVQGTYSVGLTALASLAFLEQKPSDPAVARAIDYLVSQQQADGRIGPICSGTMYNHSLATLAMLEAKRQGRHDLAAAIDRALGYVRRTQQPAGGWGYARAGDGAVNSSITVWQLQVLLRARELGWTDLDEPIARGAAWLKGRVLDDGRVCYSEQGDFPFGHETLTAGGMLCLRAAGSSVPATMEQHVQTAAAAAVSDMDFYRAYFLARALKTIVGDEAGKTAQELHAALLGRQSHEGSTAGSWAPEDRWGSAGGRVYATALAALCLETKTCCN